MRSIDLSTAVGTLESSRDLNLIVGQIVMSHDATFGTNLANDSVGNLALVKSIGSSIRNKSKSSRKINILNYVAFLEQDTTRREYMGPVWF